MRAGEIPNATNFKLGSKIFWNFKKCILVGKGLSQPLAEMMKLAGHAEIKPLF